MHSSRIFTIKKYTSPILYVIFGIFGVYIFWILYGFTRVYLIDRLGFSFDSRIILSLEALLPMFIPASFVFACAAANMLMRKMESMQSPTHMDHFRQSSLWYVLFIIAVSYLAARFQKDTNELWYAVIIIVSAMIACAIFLNAAFLWIVKKKIIFHYE